MKEREFSVRERLVKVCFWLALLFYWISGVVLTCLGVTVQVKLHDTLLVLNEAASGIPVIVTVVGAVLVLVSAFGAIALLKLNLRMLKLIMTQQLNILYSFSVSTNRTMLCKLATQEFTGMLLVILLVEIIVGVSAYSYRKQLHQTLLNDFLKTLDKYSRELQITKGVDSIQRQFQCCGAENYTDWLNATFGSFSSSVPTSCCKVSVESCDTDLSTDTADINQQGCVLKLKNWLEENMAVFGGIGIFIGLAQLTGILFCCLLLRILKENYTSLE